MPAASAPSAGLTDTWGRRNRRLGDRKCPECGGTFRPLKAASTYCSIPCARKKNGGHNRKDESWWINQKGYREGRVTVDGEKRRVKEHRLVAGRIAGRPLLPDEDVHHRDGDKTNNVPENLEVLPHAEHTRVTNSERTYRRGYHLNLTDEERAARSGRMREMRRAAIAKATAQPTHLKEL